MSRWLEVGPDNYVLTTQGSLLNTGLVVGSERALVIDTGSGPRQGREILDAVREKTQLPLVVVNTPRPLRPLLRQRGVRRRRSDRVLGA